MVKIINYQPTPRSRYYFGIVNCQHEVNLGTIKAIECNWRSLTNDIDYGKYLLASSISASRQKLY